MLDTIISIISASGFNSQPNYSLTWEQLYEHKAANRIKEDWNNSTIEMLNSLVAELKLNPTLYITQCNENNISPEGFIYILSSAIDTIVSDYNNKKMKDEG